MIILLISAIVGVFIMATSNDYERPGAGYLIFRDYENGEYIYRSQLDSLINYLAGNINAIWNPNRAYYYDWFNESNNLQVVIRWRERELLPAKGKYGERICYTRLPEKGELVDLTEPFWKDHFKVCYRCNKLDVVKL